MNIRTLLIATLALVSSASCKATAKAVEMTPTKLEFEVSHEGAVWIEAVTPGKTLGIIEERVPRAQIQAALRRAVQESGLFPVALKPFAADYRLTVDFVKLYEPEAALDMTAEVSAQWTLGGQTNATTLWSTTIKTTHTCTTFDTSFVDERGLMALERAVKANIKAGLTELAKVEL